MGRVQEGASPARGDLLHRGLALRRVDLLVAPVVVQVAREEDLHLHAPRPKDVVQEIEEVALVVPAVVPILLRVDPARVGQAEDHPVALLHRPLGDAAEIGDLAGVDVGLELPVHAEEPPPGGQLEGEVAARLARAPAPEAAAGTGEQKSREKATRLSYQSWLPGMAKTWGLSLRVAPPRAAA